MPARSPEENRAVSRMQQMSMTALRKAASRHGVEWRDATRKALIVKLVENEAAVAEMGAANDR